MCLVLGVPSKRCSGKCFTVFLGRHLDIYVFPDAMCNQEFAFSKWLVSTGNLRDLSGQNTCIILEKYICCFMSFCLFVILNAPISLLFCLFTLKFFVCFLYDGFFIWRTACLNRICLFLTLFYLFERYNIQNNLRIHLFCS